jgi:hypothetical protein
MRCVTHSRSLLVAWCLCGLTFGHCPGFWPVTFLALAALAQTSHSIRRLPLFKYPSHASLRRWHLNTSILPPLPTERAWQFLSGCVKRDVAAIIWARLPYISGVVGERPARGVSNGLESPLLHLQCAFSSNQQPLA